MKSVVNTATLKREPFADWYLFIYTELESHNKNNMKHTNLGDSIFTMKNHDTSWHSTLVGVVAMIAVTFIIFVVMSLIS